MFKDITGIILSGGKSSRMGTDKALLKFGDETIIERIVKIMKSLFEDVIIIANTPDNYSFLKIPLFQDIYKNKGPLLGIHSGLVHSRTEMNFIICCDIPMVSKELISYIVKFKSDKPIRYCRASGYDHYLAGVYSRSLIPRIEKLLIANRGSSVKKDKQLSIRNLLKGIDAEIIFVENLSFYDNKFFFNLNTPEDFEYMKQFTV